MKEMAPILHDDILISAQKVPLFRIRVLDGFEGGAYLDERVELPLYMECVETAINISQVYRVPYTVGCRQSCVCDADPDPAFRVNPDPAINISQVYRIPYNVDCRQSCVFGFIGSGSGSSISSESG